MTFKEGAYIILQEKGEYMNIRDIIQETERRPGFLGQKRQIIILLYMER